MPQELLIALMIAVLYLHFAVVLFNIFWLVAVPLGALRGWRFVRNFWWRAVHLASLGIVALQAVLGRLCFLTLWQNALAAAVGAREPPLIERLVVRAVFWPLPLWAFVVLYLAAVALAIALWILVPPQRRVAA